MVILCKILRIRIENADMSSVFCLIINQQRLKFKGYIYDVRHNYVKRSLSYYMNIYMMRNLLVMGFIE